jgi:hypothetical protein
VVDGSNIATEGRTLPSLTQLDEAVRAFMSDHPHDRVTVVVDATFGHRIDASERAVFDAAVNTGELITPPAGAIGRGDAFVLQIADRASATVLSNDSFQEFHGAYPWLFDEGRLIGGKPVPGIGWIFVLRTPVRGPMSRRAVQAAKKKSVTPAKEKTTPAEAVVAKPPARPKPVARPRASARVRAESKGPAPESPARATTRSRRRRSDASVEPLNEPMVFIDFVAAHPVGATVDGVVERFSSHGAYVTIGDARAYLALKSMGDPPPRSAREVLTLGETRSFVVQSIDTPRRGIDVALRGTAHKTDSGRSAAKATADAVGKSNKQAHAQEAPVAPAAKKAPARRTAAKKASARKTAAKKAPARRTAAKKTTARRAPAKKATRKAPAKRTTAKRAPARKTAAKKTSARKAPAKRTTAKRAPARKTAARKTTARKAPARKTTARKAPARKTAAKKTTARKAPARRTAKRATTKKA